jgi:hypothetical protein
MITHSHPCRWQFFNPSPSPGYGQFLCAYDAALACPIDPRECCSCLLRVVPDDPFTTDAAQAVPAPAAPLVRTTGSCVRSASDSDPDAAQ